jgi:hypothetical protein
LIDLVISNWAPASSMKCPVQPSCREVENSQLD